MTTQPEYGLSTVLNIPYDAAVEAVRAALAGQGFGVLTTIDVQDTLQKKLGIEMRRYVILGACNPPLAHRALEADPSVGLLLPCNVIVYEGEDPGVSVVSIFDPLTIARLSDNPALTEVADEARRRLEQVLAALG